MDKQVLKRIILENQQEIVKRSLFERSLSVADNLNYAFIGVRRAGKSYALFQHIQHLLTIGHRAEEFLYLNFEDNRLENFTNEDFDQLLDAYAEMYDYKPMLFLDEIQIIAGWEKFARRMADNKYTIYLTGSNAKMLSSEFMTTLGGRFIEKDIYPFSFKEVMGYLGIPFNELALLSPTGRANMIKNYNDYLLWGGLPESIGQQNKRDYISSTYQKIYLGDIASRNNISNTIALRLMIKKLAESVKQPISYTRLANIVSTISGKITVPTIASYIGFCEEAWLILRLRNIAVALSEKESICKYYFVDNGVLNLFLIGGETALLENLVGVQLFRMYGHDGNNDTVWYYNSNGYEVDFYIPEENWAIQVCYSLKDVDTRKREIAALSKLPKILECKRRTIFTFDEEQTIEDEFGSIEVTPTWKWLLGNCQ
ncbi:MAG: ATP-binding protein [Paludibacteraceae bacterium]|nr:ATP-binding protein [Paludibacteraceae bacterium]